jgi:hypothetical protein
MIPTTINSSGTYTDTGQSGSSPSQYTAATTVSITVAGTLTGTMVGSSSPGEAGNSISNRKGGGAGAWDTFGPIVITSGMLPYQIVYAINAGDAYMGYASAVTTLADYQSQGGNVLAGGESAFDAGLGGNTFSNGGGGPYSASGFRGGNGGIPTGTSCGAGGGAGSAWGNGGNGANTSGTGGLTYTGVGTQAIGGGAAGTTTSNGGNATGNGYGGGGGSCGTGHTPGQPSGTQFVTLTFIKTAATTSDDGSPFFAMAA